MLCNRTSEMQKQRRKTMLENNKLLELEVSQFGICSDNSSPQESYTMNIAFQFEMVFSRENRRKTMFEQTMKFLDLEVSQFGKFSDSGCPQESYAMNT